nr:MAG TPA: SRP-independent targeting protein [Caudoviricetes sp.]
MNKKRAVLQQPYLFILQVSTFCNNFFYFVYLLIPIYS